MVRASGTLRFKTRALSGAVDTKKSRECIYEYYLPQVWSILDIVEPWFLGRSCASYCDQPGTFLHESGTPSISLNLLLLEVKEMKL